MTSATNAAALANLGALPLAGGTLTGALTLPNSIFSGLSLTGSQATNTIDVSTTWNTTGNPALIYGRATNTASGATSNLLDLGTVAGGSMFKLDKAGIITLSTSGYAFGTWLTNNNRVRIGNNSSDSSEGVFIGSSAYLGFVTSSADPNFPTTVRLYGAATATLQLGTSLVSGWVSQTIAAGGGRVGTDTNNSPTNTLTIAGSRSTGTGTGGDLRLGVYGTNGTSGTAIGTLNTVLTVVAARKVINIAGIPTSATGLSSGDVYSNAGILTIVA